jgi:hypothetical protein
VPREIRLLGVDEESHRAGANVNLPHGERSGRVAINTIMTKCCSSRSRCARTDCAVCTRRYAGRLSRRILTIASGKLFAIELQLPSPSLADFWTFRVEARNFIDHRRRCCPWWRALMLHLWLSQDGRVCGIGSLGSLTSSEVLEALQPRWPTSIRPLSSENLRSEIVQIVRPDLLPSADLSARYQSMKLAIWPRREKRKATLRIELPRYDLEPMPIVF